MMKTIILLVFLLPLTTYGQGQSRKLLARVNAKIKLHNKKVLQLFKHKPDRFDKLELKKAYGKDIFRKKLVVYPGQIRMKFPESRTLDTNNIYRNIDKLKFSKRKGSYYSFIVYNDRLIGVMETASLNDKAGIWVPAVSKHDSSGLANYTREFEAYRKLDGYITILIEKPYGGFDITLDKTGNVYASDYTCNDGTISRECLVTLEEALLRYNIKNWSKLFKN